MISHLSTQCAAVRILVGLINDPPHSTCPLAINATCQRSFTNAIRFLGKIKDEKKQLTTKGHEFLAA
jgi:hypothetical protein